MFAIGCDVEKIKRFRAVLKNEEFLSRIFTPCEIRYCFGKAKPEVYLARKFACKEAIFKALSAFGQKIPVGLIEIRDKGKGRNEAAISYRGISGKYRISLSVSNTEKMVLASSIAEER